MQSNAFLHISRQPSTSNFGLERTKALSNSWDGQIRTGQAAQTQGDPPLVTSSLTEAQSVGNHESNARLLSPAQRQSTWHLQTRASKQSGLDVSSKSFKTLKTIKTTIRHPPSYGRTIK